MSTVVTLDEAQAQLKELVAGLAPGEEIVITDDQRPVAKLMNSALPVRKPRVAGSAKGKLILLHEDDEHLKDFEEYLK